MDRAGGPRGERGWTILEVLLVVALAALLLAIALPNFRSARIRNNEAAAVRTLREVAAGQEMARKAVLVDEDSDGRGEFAVLQELAGLRNPRAYVPRSGSVLPAGLPQFSFGPEGEATVCGYRFRLFLPGEGGRGVREVDGTPEGKVDPALAAAAWCAYAWPVRSEGFLPAATGGRTFFANQTGLVLAADGPYSVLPRKEGEPALAPEPGAAFAPPGGLATITGPPALGTVGRDGLLWRSVH